MVITKATQKIQRKSLFALLRKGKSEISNGATSTKLFLLLLGAGHVSLLKSTVSPFSASPSLCFWVCALISWPSVL